MLLQANVGEPFSNVARINETFREIGAKVTNFNC